MSNQESDNNKVNLLIAILDEKFGLTGKEIADIFWLMQKRQEYTNGNSNQNFYFDDIVSPEVITESNPYSQTNSYSEKTDISPEFSTISSDRPNTDTKKPPQQNPTSSLTSQDTTSTVDAIPKTPTSSTISKTIPLRIPDAPSLREPLELARSLKPLMRPIDSKKGVVLDETKSAERTAAEGFLIPVPKPESEPLLEIALVVDESKSMLIWRHTIIELKRLLESSGFFRDVRTWGLVTDENGKISLHPRIGTIVKNQRSANHRELIDPNGRRLVLVVSDCVAAIWRNGAINSIFQDWTNTQPVAIIQMLPDWLWLKTGLSSGASVLFGSLAPNVANKELLIKEQLLWKDINLNTGIKLPVFTLQSKVAANWSQMVAGKSDVNAPGFVFPRKLEVKLKSNSKNTKSQLTSQQRVSRFRRTASAMARKLAYLLAAAPVINLPVVRLIQETMLPQSEQVHVAEVFLGGLLKPLIEIEADTNPDMVQYDFMDDEIRNTLLETAPVSDSVDVLDTVSKYVANQIGKSVQEFVALLKAPGETEDEQVKRFAEIAVEILKQLGGDYAVFAEEIKSTLPSNTEFTEVLEVYKGFPPLQISEFRIRTISFKESETHKSVNLQPFTFESATIELKKSGFFGRNTEVIIHRHQKQSQYFIEDLGNGIELEMILIPAGTFIMGAPEDERGSKDDERPQHQVKVPTFFMGRYQITQAQWRVVANFPQVERELKPEPSRFKGDNLPVERVSWYDAVEFCARLSNHTRREYRLPSEAEWEYACRARTSTPFHFGETITGELANYAAKETFADKPKGEYREQTTPVGQFPPNAFGLYDMHGNVWEWCFDNYHFNYKGAPVDGSAWVESNNNNNHYRVLRGGSWYNDPDYCRSANRYDFSPVFGNDAFGLRVVYRYIYNPSPTLPSGGEGARQRGWGA